jgi:hypothetical protein
MPVQYVRVDTTVDMFVPLARPTGVVAIVGTAPTGDDNVPFLVTSPSEATGEFGEAVTGTGENRVLNSPLTSALLTALGQTPGPSQLWGVRSSDTAAALRALEGLPVNFVVLANTPLSQVNSAAVGELQTHVTSVSNSGDGNERMGVVMLPKDSVGVSLVTGNLANDRMVYVAHRCHELDGDPAAAVAGTIAGYPPHVSMLLKPVAIKSAPFTAAQIDELNKPEKFGDPPQGQGVNWLARPALIPGQGVYLGEGYTSGPMGFIDIRRTVDDITFRLKARFINAIGNVRMSRAGLRTLLLQAEAVLSQLVADGVIDGFDATIPVLELLDADPATLSDVQLQRIKEIQDSRVAKVLVSVDYNGGIHRIDVGFTLD